MITKTDIPTPSASFRVPRGSFIVRLYDSLAALPRLASGVILSVLTLASSSSVAFADTQLNNPLNPTFSSIPLFIAGALKVMVMVALPIISLFIVYSGFLFVAAQGNESKLSNAKSNLLYVIIGSILILGAWVIATLIGGTVSQLTTG